MSDPIDAMLDDPKPAEAKPEGDSGAPPPSPAPQPAPQPEPTPTPAPQPTPGEPAQPAAVKPPIEPGHVPLAAMLDEREKRQKIERDFEAFKKQHQQPPKPPPSPYDDPDAYSRHVDGRLAQLEQNMRLNHSEERTEEKHGATLLNEAKAWAERIAQEEAARGETRFATFFLNHPKPFEWLIATFKRDKFNSEVGDDPDAWARKRVAELDKQGGQPGSPQPTPQAKPFAAPKTIAGTPSAAGAGARSIPVGPSAAFEAVFPE